ncbi:MAG: replication restart helicase PriA [Brevinemataceae bacterium]
MSEPWLLAEVALNVPLHSTFYYIIPKHLQDKNIDLKRVRIHFGRREEIGLVLRTVEESNVEIDLKSLPSVKEIEEIMDNTPIFTKELLELGSKVSDYYHTPIGEVLFTMLPPFKEPKALIHPEIKKSPLSPTEEQQQAFDTIKPFIGKNTAFLLQGVTGSGKTEVYKLLARECLNQGKGVIILVPEIALTAQTLRRFTEEFSGNTALFHSKLSPAERAGEWERVLTGKAKLVIGPRSAVFAPINNLGLIILDEEHDPSYKAMDSPRYHARGTAFMRSKSEQALLVLGSATPSIETRYAASTGRIHHVILNNRFNNTELPATEIIDLKKEKSGNYFLSEILFKKILTTLDNKKQCLIFLNRRGYSPSLICRDCGFLFKCPNCDIGMTWYKNDSRIKCRYCEFDHTAPSDCPECGGFNIKDAGFGTEKLEESLQELLPEKKILRLDLDTARKKNNTEKILQAMRNHEADILIGTQMIAKGHDIADIELVGALFPEIMLSLPDFRSSERTFSLLSQAIGRAGRRDAQGSAVIQTYLSEHFAVQLAAEQNFEAFYLKELEIRKQFHYPPFTRIGRIVFKSSNYEILNNLIFILKKKINSKQNEFKDLSIEILGPGPCPIERINNNYRYHIIVKAPTHQSVLKTIKFFRTILKAHPSHDKIKSEIDIDPAQIL